MNLIDELRHDAAGVATLKDWLGDGGIPVPPEQSASRALACTSGDEDRPCPHNIEAGWWSRNVTNPIAQEILKQIEVKNRLKISTPSDAYLHVCSKCRCCLPLKVHAPIKFIAAHLTEETFSSMPAFCWQRQEYENHV